MLLASRGDRIGDTYRARENPIFGILCFCGRILLLRDEMAIGRV